MAGERRGLVGDALLQVAVGADDEGVVVAELGAEPGPQPLLGHAHAHPVGHALTERTGRDLDARRVVALRVARRPASVLPELAQVLELQAEPGEVEHRVEQDRRVAGRQDEAVVVGPVRRLGVVIHHPRPQDVRQRRQRHRRARVSGVGRLRPVHRQASDDVDRLFLEGQTSLPSRGVATLPSRPAPETDSLSAAER